MEHTIQITRPDEGSAIAVAEILSSSDVWDMTLPWIWGPICWDLDVLARYKRVGYTFVSLTLQDWPPTLEGMRTQIQQFRDLVSEHSEWLVIGTSVADIDKGRRDGKLVVGFHSQETRPIGENLTNIEALHAMGVRHMVLAYNVRNVIADGCAETADAGLSNFGRQVVREMNRVGVLVDCSHTGRRSSLEAIDLSERPVIFSHSNAYSVCPHIRNIHDDQIRACAARGGVIGVVGVGGFLGEINARSESVFKHIDYISDLVGPAHVGLGTDYVKIFPKAENIAIWEAIDRNGKPWPDPANAWPNPTGTQIRGAETHCFAPEQLVELVQLMLAHGYSRDVIRMILGGNFRRVYNTVC